MWVLWVITLLRLILFQMQPRRRTRNRCDFLLSLSIHQMGLQLCCW